MQKYPFKESSGKSNLCCPFLEAEPIIYASVSVSHPCLIITTCRLRSLLYLEQL